MEYQDKAEISPVLRTPNLKPRVEDQYQLETLACLEYMLTQVLEKVGERTISPAQEVLTESINTSESNLEIDSYQPPLTPDMSPIRRPEEPAIIPYCFLSETKLSVVLDKIQEIFLEFLLGSAEIYLAREERSRSKEKFLSNSERKYGNGSKGNKLRAPYKDRNNQIEGTSKPFMKRLFYYSKPKESLFYKETMVRVNKPPRIAEK